MTVRELLSRIGSDELAEWAAYNSIEPIDTHWRGDLQAGIVASTVANCHRSGSSKSFSPVDFMPMHDKKGDRVQSEDEMKSVMKKIAGNMK